FHVEPVAHVACPLRVGRYAARHYRLDGRLRAGWRADFGIDASGYPVGGVCCEENWVGVGVDVLPEVLWVAVVGTEASGPVIKGHKGYTRSVGADQVHILHVTGLEFVQDRRAESMDPAELCVGGTNDLRVGKAAGTRGAARPEFVIIPLPLEVDRDPVVGIPVVVEASRHPSAIEEVADGSRTESCGARILEVHAGTAR